MSYFLSSEGIKASLFGVAVFTAGIPFIRTFRSTWFSNSGAGLGLSASQAQLAVYAMGPLQAWITIKAMELIGLPRKSWPMAILAGISTAGVLDSLSFAEGGFRPYDLDGERANVRVLSTLLFYYACDAAAVVLSQD